MITIYRLFKVVYDENSQKKISSISLVGNEFVVPDQCAICNNTDIKMMDARLSIKDIKMTGNYRFQLPYCKKHRKLINIYDIIIGLGVFILTMLGVFLVFKIVEPDLSLSSWVSVFITAAFLGGFMGITVGWFFAAFIKPIFINRVNNKAGIWGVKLFKALDDISIPDPFVKIGFTFHNEPFAEALIALNPSILVEFSDDSGSFEDQLKIIKEEIDENKFVGDKFDDLIRKGRQAVEEKNKALFDPSDQRNIDS